MAIVMGPVEPSAARDENRVTAAILTTAGLRVSERDN